MEYRFSLSGCDLAVVVGAGFRSEDEFAVEYLYLFRFPSKSGDSSNLSSTTSLNRMTLGMSRFQLRQTHQAGEKEGSSSELYLCLSSCLE